MNKLSELAKENEELKTHILQLESQIDSYRLGKEMAAWPPAVDVIKEGLTGDIEAKKKELAALIARVEEFTARIKSLSQDIIQKEYLAREANSLKAEIALLERKASSLRGDYDLTDVMQIIRKLFMAYEFTNNIFRYRLGKSDDLTSSDVETLIRRAIKTKTA